MNTRLPGWLRLPLVMTGWALVGIALRVELWLGAVVALILVSLWLYRLRETAGPGRTWMGSILLILGWAALSLLAWVGLYFVLLVIATVGAGFGWWGSPWDDR
jgi:hypothetical protein